MNNKLACRRCLRLDDQGSKCSYTCSKCNKQCDGYIATSLCETIGKHKFYCDCELNKMEAKIILENKEKYYNDQKKYNTIKIKLNAIKYKQNNLSISV